MQYCSKPVSAKFFDPTERIAGESDSEVLHAVVQLVHANIRVLEEPDEIARLLEVVSHLLESQNKE